MAAMVKLSGILWDMYCIPYVPMGMEELFKEVSLKARGRRLQNLAVPPFFSHHWKRIPQGLKSDNLPFHPFGV